MSDQTMLAESQLPPEMEHLYRLALEGGKHGIWILDLRREQFVLDAHARRIIGVGPDEVLTLDAGIGLIHPADREQALEAFRKATDPNGPGRYDIEKRVVWPDGTERWLSISGGVQFEEDDAQQRAMMLAGVLTDITEQKKAEETIHGLQASFQLAIRHSPTVIWQQDNELRYRWIFNSKLGYEDEAVVGKRDVDLMERAQDAMQSEAVKRRVLESGVARREEIGIFRDGHMYYYDVSIDPLFDAAGAADGITCAAWDITGRRALEEELEKALAELAELNEKLEERVEERTEQVLALHRALTMAEQEERRRIAQVLHDDIQQMLVALHIQLNLLEGSVAPDLQPEVRNLYTLTGKIVEATRSLSVELSEEVLDSQDLADILGWLARMMKRQYHLDVAVETAGPCTLGDPNTRELIVKAARELLFNVYKHAGVRHARVKAWTTGKEVVVVVGDEGAGFDVDAAIQAAQQNGESFGLLNVRERIRLFGGRLEIESAPGQGTRSIIQLPLAIS